MKRLLDTAPHKFIEASVCSKSGGGGGGGCPFGSDIYEQGQVPGANLCGKQLTKYRDAFWKTCLDTRCLRSPYFFPT